MGGGSARSCPLLSAGRLGPPHPPTKCILSPHATPTPNISDFPPLYPGLPSPLSPDCRRCVQSGRGRGTPPTASAGWRPRCRRDRGRAAGTAPRSPAASGASGGIGREGRKRGKEGCRCQRDNRQGRRHRSVTPDVPGVGIRAEESLPLDSEWAKDLPVPLP